ncbi:MULTISPECIES: amino acid ABC transporter permease [Azorhizobium]|uniref:Amino acid ABC transporter permease protein n=1 Tax=Azorhizobium caulinodans (strain ATCC 43989 / DSM 5975 / JCM 20966 / LMG 6465 / NBRC 14845 / NCIMB 13405 / ORS 571) TaxID=438753 RepID=A8I8M6_AZOC5|nr:MULTISPECIES: amino acid ABC transporter permease [Azorhizobium]TDT99829.1 amino acid ABC transporter membrane protein 1 (PAAT family) [Azorhizobium sp. AG788]BAF88679.1 amino acid ABC transporter permease protein [Azorhizobium caulinodans ORS 571]
MSYTLQFGQIWPYLPRLLEGAVISLQIAVLAFCGGLFIGTLCAAIRSFGPRWLARIVGVYVVFFTNTPQLVQIYFLYFALPDSGILLSSFAAVVIGMTLNAGAYLTEIQRAGFESRRVSEMEAAEVMGFSRLQQIRYVILPHVARVLFPPLSNQFIIVTLGTSMAAVFGVEELTGEAFNINSQTFRSIEIFSVTAGIYVVLTLAASLLLAFAGRTFFRARTELI